MTKLSRNKLEPIVEKYKCLHRGCTGWTSPSPSLHLPALRVPMCGVRVTDEDLCFGMVRRLEVKGPFGYDPWLQKEEFIDKRTPDKVEHDKKKILR